MLTSYLSRIGVDASGRACDLALLTELQIAHLIAVPFENLDVFHRRGVSTDPTVSITKIVDRRRGGWCFELNGSFGWLLAGLGYDVTYASCRVHDDGEWGPDLDHCALVVRLDGEPWFVDVGFGDCCTVPIPLSPGDHDGTPRAVRMRAEDQRLVMAECFANGTWHDQLDIDPTPRAIDEFTPRSTYLQTEPGLLWTTKPFATRATAPDGSRVTLRNGVLRMRDGAAEFVDTPIDDGDFARLASLHFGL